MIIFAAAFIWVLLWFSSKIQCQTTMSFRSFDDNSTFDYNKTMEDINLSLNNAIEMNNVLDKLIALQNPSNTSKFIPTTDPANLAVATASLAITTAALAVQSAQFAYQVDQDKKNAEAQEIREAELNAQHAKLVEQNGQIIEKLDKIHTAIQAAADQISDTLIQVSFYEKVITRMASLFSRYNIFMLFDTEEHKTRFMENCNENDPFDIVSVMVTMTDQLFKAQMKSTEYEKHRFFSLIMMYLNVMNRFYIVQPHCSKLNFPSSTIDDMNITIIQAQKSVDEALSKNGVNKLKLSSNADFIAPLYKSVQNESEICADYENRLAEEHCIDRKLNDVYGILKSTFKGLGFYFKIDLAFFVADETHSSSLKISLPPSDDPYVNYVRTGDYITITTWLQNPPCTYKFPDEHTEELCQMLKESSSEYEGFKKYLDKYVHCKRAMFTISFKTPRFTKGSYRIYDETYQRFGRKCFEDDEYNSVVYFA